MWKGFEFYKPYDGLVPEKINGLNEMNSKYN